MEVLYEAFSIVEIKTRSGRYLGQMREFREVVRRIGLGDLSAKGGKFTLCDITEEEVLYVERLDRGLGNLTLKHPFPYACIEVLKTSHYEHMPLLL